MGKLFGNLSTEGLEEAKDIVGGYQPLPSDVYEAVIKMAYVTQSASSEASAVNLVFTANGSEHRQQIYVTNRTGENFYVDKKTGKKNPLPGFTNINDLCLLTTEQGLAEQETEEKMVKQYDPDTQKELPKPTPVLTALTGKTVKMGIIRQIRNKQKLGDDGQYHDTEEFRTENEINKFFHPETNRTVNEYLHEVTTPEFHDEWIKVNRGKDRDRTKKSAGLGRSGTGKPSAAGQTPKQKLFG